jgi:hypothetical protein
MSGESRTRNEAVTEDPFLPPAAIRRPELDFMPTAMPDAPAPSWAHDRPSGGGESAVFDPWVDEDAQECVATPEPVYASPDDTGVLTPDASDYAGPGAVTTYDSVQRSKYLSRNKGIQAQTLDAIEDAAKSGDVAAAEDAARAGVNARNASRATSQAKLSPGGRVLSEVVDRGWTWDMLEGKYKPTADPSDPFDIYRKIGSATGRSNRAMSFLAKFGRVAGPAALAYGLWDSANDIADAPPEERKEVACGEAGGLVGGSLGATVGTGLGAVAAGFLMSNPVGWGAIALGMLGGMGGGFLGSRIGEDVGREVCRPVDPNAPRHNPLDDLTEHPGL